ncbi:ferritin, heavy subunit-like [Pteronotus mesoamericanus]|uniref:ferritin, heavy subunit-like n=1 Tax=Pteronotus mesoamericanus TaxID=1884717 RepID=UPI0023ED9DE3|nr:ferritin, heavy subunit-like [Pteronotus parnellii mesoamericanus]
MAYQAQNLISEECRVAINHVASYELHISDAYLSMACYYNEDTEAPLFAAFFEDQAEVKREHGKQFLRYLRRREGQICLPVIKRPDIDTWGTGIKALESALELENKLTQLLQDLKTVASDSSDKDLVRFMGKYLDKQRRNTSYLEHQLIYHRRLEKQAQQEEPFEKPAEVSGLKNRQHWAAYTTTSPTDDIGTGE